MNGLLSGAAMWAVLVATPAVRPVQPAAPAATGDETIVCRAIALEPVRTWTFASRGGIWRVTHELAGRTRRASLVLPRADVTLTAERVDLRARTANGGIDVALGGPWARATLDAYVSYELEVNVDASLTPDIDEIATDAPTGVRCTRLDTRVGR